MSDNKSAELVYMQWRSLRTSTASHRMWCDCPDCKKRYRFAQAIVLPTPARRLPTGLSKKESEHE